MSCPIATKLSVVVRVMVRNVYLRNRPNRSRYGREKGGKFEFLDVPSDFIESRVLATNCLPNFLIARMNVITSNIQNFKFPSLLNFRDF